MFPHIVRDVTRRHVRRRLAARPRRHRRHRLQTRVLQAGQVLAGRGHRHVVVLALFLRQQFEPSVDLFLEDLGDAERERAHEVVARGSVPVPHLDEQPSVLVVGLQVKGQGFAPLGVEVGLDGAGLALDARPVVRNEFALDVGVAEAVRVHRDQVLGLLDFTQQFALVCIHAQLDPPAPLRVVAAAQVGHLRSNDNERVN